MSLRFSYPKKNVVIVGGGTAGLVIANNLQSKFNVTVIEKSYYKKYPLIYKIPLMIGLLFRSKYVSCFEIDLPSGRKGPFYESNILGGSSIMNGCVHMLGTKKLWNYVMKDFNSGYNDVFESFKRLYTYDKGVKGKIRLTTLPKRSIDHAFIQTFNQRGIPEGDMNYSDYESTGSIHVTANKYFRSSVISLIQKHLFQLNINDKVQNLEFDDQGKILGVITKNGKINADYVILTGGVIGTCELMLKVQKEQISMGNKMFENLPFGTDIRDHPNLRINVIANQNLGSLNEINKSFFKKIMFMLKHICGFPTLLRGTGASSGVHLDLDKDGIIDTRIQIVNFTESGRHGSDGKIFGDDPGFSLSISPIRTESKGYINIQESKKYINPSYLTVKTDIDLLIKALKLCIEILHEKPLSDYVLKIENYKQIQSNPEKYILEKIFSGHHLIGGMNKVVNQNYEVKNTTGLYVSDASVFKNYVGSNIHSSVVINADIFSTKFIQKNS